MHHRSTSPRRSRRTGLLSLSPWLVIPTALAACDGGAPGDSAGSNAPNAGTIVDEAGVPSTNGASAAPIDGGSATPEGAPPVGGDGGVGDAGGTSCGAGDPNMPPEPVIPAACATLEASQTVPAGAVPDEGALDTARIQAALDGCAAGKAVRLAPGGGHGAFITGPLTLPSGVTLWVDAGATLYGTRNPAVYGAATALITARGTGSGVVGDGVIDGQGGEPKIGATGTWWDANGAGGQSPALIEVRGATRFTLYRITLHDAPMFHVKLGSAGFVVWGVTIKTPSKPTNSAGTALTPSSAHNTDGVDPGEAASDGFIVCSKISDGDDHVAIKGTGGVRNLTIAHNRFGAGHGMSIGSETSGGVSNVHVYDLSIDGTGTGLKGGSSNGLRIKSDPSRGGLVEGVVYEDVCTREIVNPILITPRYSSATGSLIPEYKGIVVRNFHALAGATTPIVTLDGYDDAHRTGITLDGVVVDGVSAANVRAAYADVTIGPGGANFVPSGATVTTSSADASTAAPNPCSGKWVTF